MLIKVPLKIPLPRPLSAYYTTLQPSPYRSLPAYLIIHRLSIIFCQLHEHRNVIYLPLTPACSAHCLPWGQDTAGSQEMCAEWE